jgi:hypothetical protein
MFSLILVLVNVYLLYLLVLEKHNEQNTTYLLQKPNTLLLNYIADKKNECYCEEHIIQNHSPNRRQIKSTPVKDANIELFDGTNQLQIYQPKPNYSARIIALMGFGLCFQIIYSIITIKYCHKKYKNKDTFLDKYMRKNL